MNRFSYKELVVAVGFEPAFCSGSMIPDTSVGGIIATISKAFYGQKTTNYESTGEGQSLQSDLAVIQTRVLLPLRF
jgi:hypothetical protein